MRFQGLDLEKKHTTNQERVVEVPTVLRVEQPVEVPQVLVAETITQAPRKPLAPNSHHKISLHKICSKGWVARAP